MTLTAGTEERVTSERERSRGGGELPPLQAKPMKLIRRPDGTLVLAAPGKVLPMRPTRSRTEGVGAGGDGSTGVGSRSRAGGGGEARVIAMGGPTRRVRARGTSATLSRSQRFLAERLQAEIRVKLVVLGLIAVLGAGFASHGPPQPEPPEVVFSLPDVEAGEYVRIELPDHRLPGVSWFARVGTTALAVVDDGWKEMSRDRRLEILRTLTALAGEPAEVLVLSARSELWAEVYGRTYHIYD